MAPPQKPKSNVAANITKPPRVSEPGTPKLEPAAPFDEAPVIEAIGYCRVKNGWTALRLSIQSGVVVDSEALTQEPVSKALAMERVRLGVKDLLAGLLRGDA